MRFKFDGKIYEIDNPDLSKIVSEAFRELQNKERKSGGVPLSGGVGLFALAVGEGMPLCMACGAYQDYSGNCNYTSQVIVIENGSENNKLCQVYDIPLVHAIGQGKLDSYILKEVENAK